MLTAVAAPPMFSVVVVALIRLKVVCEVVISPPLTARSPVRTVSPPMFTSPAIPTPPSAMIEPVVVLDDAVVFRT